MNHSRDERWMFGTSLAEGDGAREFRERRWIKASLWLTAVWLTAWAIWLWS